MGKDKKYHEEKLQEIRSKNHNKLRYRKRVQDEEEADRLMDEFLKRGEEDNDPLQTTR